MDFRVMETEGLGTFTALQRRGIPSKLLYFPQVASVTVLPFNVLFIPLNRRTTGC